MMEEGDDNIPSWLRWLFISINRVGFPIVAFVLMWWMAQVSISKVVGSVAENTLVLTEVRDELQRMHR